MRDKINPSEIPGCLEGTGPKRYLNIFPPCINLQADLLFQTTIANPSNEMYCAFVQKAVNVAVTKNPRKKKSNQLEGIMQKEKNGETNPSDSKSNQGNNMDNENATGRRNGGRGLGQGGGKGRRDGTGGGRGRGGGGKGGRQRG